MKAHPVSLERLDALNIDAAALGVAAEAALASVRAGNPQARRANFTHSGRTFAIDGGAYCAAFSVDLLEGQSRTRVVSLTAEPPLTSGRGRRLPD